MSNLRREELLSRILNLFEFFIRFWLISPLLSHVFHGILLRRWTHHHILLVIATMTHGHVLLLLLALCREALIFYEVERDGFTVVVLWQTFGVANELLLSSSFVSSVLSNGVGLSKHLLSWSVVDVLSSNSFHWLIVYGIFGNNLWHWLMFGTDALHYHTLAILRHELTVNIGGSFSHNNSLLL